MWGHISLPWRIVTQNWVTEVASFPPTTPRREAQLALGHVAKLQTHWRRRVIPALAWSRGILTYELQQSSTPPCHTPLSHQQRAALWDLRGLWAHAQPPSPCLLYSKQGR